jgi:hypothetical protein
MAVQIGDEGQTKWQPQARTSINMPGGSFARVNAKRQPQVAVSGFAPSP